MKYTQRFFRPTRNPLVSCLVDTDGTVIGCLETVSRDNPPKPHEDSKGGSQEPSERNTQWEENYPPRKNRNYLENPD